MEIQKQIEWWENVDERFPPDKLPSPHPEDEILDKKVQDFMFCPTASGRSLAASQIAERLKQINLLESNKRR